MARTVAGSRAQAVFLGAVIDLIGKLHFLMTHAEAARRFAEPDSRLRLMRAKFAPE